MTCSKKGDLHLLTHRQHRVARSAHTAMQQYTVQVSQSVYEITERAIRTFTGLYWLRLRLRLIRPRRPLLWYHRCLGKKRLHYWGLSEHRLYYGGLSEGGLDSGLDYPHPRQLRAIIHLVNFSQIHWAEILYASNDGCILWVFGLHSVLSVFTERLAIVMHYRIIVVFLVVVRAFEQINTAKLVISI